MRITSMRTGGQGSTRPRSIDRDIVKTRATGGGQVGHLAFVGSHRVTRARRRSIPSDATRVFSHVDRLFPDRSSIRPTASRFAAGCNSGQSWVTKTVVRGVRVRSFSTTCGVGSLGDQADGQSGQERLAASRRQQGWCSPGVRERPRAETSIRARFSDVHIKRIHEYKRPVGSIYGRDRSISWILGRTQPRLGPRVKYFGKAAPSYLRK